MTEIELFPLDIDYSVIDDKPVVRVFGLTDKGEKRILYDEAFEPYCHIDAPVKEVRQLCKSMYFVTDIKEIKKKRLGREETVCRVTTKLPEDVPKLKELNLKVYDADIPFYKRYMLDKGLGTFTKARFLIDGDRIKEIRSVTEGTPPLKPLAFDIETFSKRSFPNSKTDPVLAISFQSYDAHGCITWVKTEKNGIIETVADERALLERFAELIVEGGYNVLIGYNSDGFDLPYIADRAKILGFSLNFGGFGIKVKGEQKRVSEINGLAHIDVLNFIRNIYAVYNLKTEVLTLDAVAREMLGESKDNFDWEKIESVLSDTSLATSLCTYCMKDSLLTFRIYERLYPLIAELNRLTGQLFADVSRMTTGAAAEQLIMKRAVELNEVVPNRPSAFEVEERLKRSNVGAFVYQPKPGLYENVAVVDFRSLYPSIIISRNICPSTIERVDGKIEYREKEKGVGLIPLVLSEIISRRIEAKDRLKMDQDNQFLKARISVLKLIANGFYGYLGYFNARWYCFECAGTITALARDYIHEVISKAEDSGSTVLYGDTDSAMISREGIKEWVDAFIAKINASLPKPMELELQGVYPRALFVTTKSGTKGAKKKYAMSDDKKNLIVKGFQSVRRDWSVIAKETQLAVLRKILIDNDKEGALALVKNVIADLNGNRVPLEKLVILTRLRKEISSYRQTNRHVSAASRSGLTFGSGDTIKYVVVKGTASEKVSDRTLLYDIARQNKARYDPDYYVNKQVMPAVMQILSVVGYSEEDIASRKNDNLANF